MKTCVISLALIISGFVGFAQKTFTQDILKGMLEEFKRDSKAFFINRLSEDFRYSNPQGKFLRKNDITTTGTQKIVSTSDAQKIVTTLQGIESMLENFLANDVLEPVILQSCDLAIVSGRHKTTWIGNDGNKTTGEVSGTYSFQKRKGKWIFVAAQQTPANEK
ncbi:MAG TPA: hypothetical protein VFP97_06060 [Chitinophagaceae bacterium]|nr:hypothetical protein [Chitinophagaceae bacterium]